MQESMKLSDRLLNLRNMVDYPLRQFFHLRRGTVSYTNDREFDDYAHLTEPDRTRAQQYEKRYLFKYRLEKIKRELTAGNYYENVFYLHMLQEAFDQLKPSISQQILAADVGTSHWFYVQALWSFYTWYQTDTARQVILDGYEADAFRLYSDFHSRYDHAITHIGGLPDVHFKPTGFASGEAQYDIITLFFPFVFERDLLKWGLPSQNFNPTELIKTAWNSIKPGGVLMIVNQGMDEHRKEQEICVELSIPVKVNLHIEPLLFKYDYERYIIAAIK
jgi:hypothetical protein